MRRHSRSMKRMLSSVFRAHSRVALALLVALFVVVGMRLLDSSRAGTTHIVFEQPGILDPPIETVSDGDAHEGQFIRFGESLPEQSMSCAVQVLNSYTQDGYYYVQLGFTYAIMGIADRGAIGVEVIRDRTYHPDDIDLSNAYAGSSTYNYTQGANDYTTIAQVRMRYQDLSADCETPVTIPALELTASCSLSEQRVVFDIAKHVNRFSFSLDANPSNPPIASIIFNPGYGNDLNIGTDIAQHPEIIYDRPYSANPQHHFLRSFITINFGGSYAGQSVTCERQVPIEHVTIRQDEYVPAGYFMEQVSQASSLDGVTFWVNAFHDEIYNRAVAQGVPTYGPVRAFTDPNAPGSSLMRSVMQEPVHRDSTTLAASLPSHVANYRAAAQAYMETVSRMPVRLFASTALNEVLFVYDKQGVLGQMFCDYHFDGPDFYCNQPGSPTWRFGILITINDAEVNRAGVTNSRYENIEEVTAHEWGHVWQYHRWPGYVHVDSATHTRHNPPWFTGYDPDHTSKSCATPDGLAGGDPDLRCWNFRIIGFPNGYAASRINEDMGMQMGWTFSQPGWFHSGYFADRYYRTGSFSGSPDTYLRAKVDQTFDRIRSQGVNLHVFHVNDANASIYFSPQPSY